MKLCLLVQFTFFLFFHPVLLYSINEVPYLSITCPPEVIVSTDENVCIATNVNIGNATTGGDPGEIIFNDAPSEFPLGTTTVTWTVTDGVETESCTQLVTVRDVESPQLPIRMVWEDLQTVSNVSDPLDNSGYGARLKLDGDYAVVGAGQHTGAGGGAGAAFVLERNSSGVWTEVQEITASGVNQNTFYGNAVDIKEDLIIVGGRVHETDEYGEGVAFIWERNTSGTWIENAELLASDRANRDWFGVSVGIDGDFALVGANGEDGFGSGSGAVYAFERDGSGNWNEVQKFCSNDCTAGDQFGSSLILHGDTAIIMSPKEDVVVQNEGAAYVFVRDTNGTWSQVQKIIYSGALPNEEIGPEMALDGNYLVISHTLYDSTTDNVGAAIVYKKNASGAFIEDQLLVAPDGNYKDFFSISGIAIENGTIAINSRDESAHYNSGAVYVFELQDNGQWEYSDKIVPTSTTHHLFGTSLDFYDETELLIGAPSFGSSVGAENAIYYVRSSLATTIADTYLGCGESVIAPILEDNCAGAITGITSDALPTTSLGTYDVTWDFDDGANPVSYDQSITVYDAIAPALTCADVTVAVDPDGTFQLSDADLGITYSDACATVTVITQPNIWINCSDVGTQNYIIQVEDDAGNRSDCVGTVTTLNASDTVLNLNDAGANSLRDLVNDGCAGDTLYFDQSLAGGTITLDSEIDITKSKVIVGLGVDDLTLDGINRFRAFHITNSNLDVHISKMKLINGNDEFQGGAILNEGNLFLSDMIFINNNEISVPKVWTNLKDIDIKSGTVEIRE